MPALPWVHVGEVDADASCTVMASRLPLRSYRRIPSFIRATLRIRGLARRPRAVQDVLDTVRLARPRGARALRSR
jgi:ribosomal protein L30/L7E